MKVGILTFHEVFNPGAFFQALSTQRILEKMGHDAWIIDYTSPAHRFNPFGVLFRHPLHVVRHCWDWQETFGRNRAFQKCHYLLRKTKLVLRRQELKSMYFDRILVGADIVWNYQLDFLGKDPVYFGQDLNCGKLIAYAPSCGNVDLTEPIPNYVSDGLKRFSAISVRDDKTADLVENVTKERPSVIRDPALELNLTDFPLETVNQGEYAAVYSAANCLDARFIEDIRNFCKKEHLPTKALCYRQTWTDENHITISPIQWLQYIANAKYVFTTTFHGSVFSIKTGRQFVTQFCDETKSKSLPLFESLGLINRVWKQNGDIERIAHESWDKKKVESRISELNTTAAKFLSNALE